MGGRNDQSAVADTAWNHGEHMSTLRGMRNHRSLGLAAVGVITALAVTACGPSDDSDKDGKSGASKAADEAPKNLKLGQPGPVQEITSYKKTGKFSITPTKVSLGKPEDLKELDDPKKYKDKKIAWIYVKAKHVGGPAIKEAKPMSDVGAETDAGAPATRFILIGTLASTPKDCNLLNGVKELGSDDIWKKGEERTVCEPYLVPATAKVKNVTYSQGFYKEPLKWAVK
ncbi:lipoprotein [Streptomyces flavofungini]|nr:lipoprotein [Streptomyces flavofungini]